MRRAVAPSLLLFFLACSASSPPAATGGDDGGPLADASAIDATTIDGAASDATDEASPRDASDDARADTNDASDACSVDGNPGHCIATSDCAALGGHTSYPGYCPGPASIECCAKTPNVADNPPTPAGYRLMMQSEVTPDMTTWAVQILNDPTDYPMFATATRTFGAQLVLARVEWHPPDFNNGVVHRGVTLYVPIVDGG